MMKEMLKGDTVHLSFTVKDALRCSVAGIELLICVVVNIAILYWYWQYCQYFYSVLLEYCNTF